MAGYDCSFVTDPPDQLICLICTFVARNPHQVDCCGRVYCKDCLDELKARSNECPICRKHCNSFLDRRADRDIQALQVKCENGCEWNGELHQLDSHVANCEFALINCPNNCLDDEFKEVFMMRKELSSHLAECPNREFECPHCKERGKYHEIAGDHMDDCPQLEVPCPKRCKIEVVRSRMREHLSHTCPNVAVACKYSSLGCKECLLRKDLEEHETDSPLHLQLALDTVVLMKADNSLKVILPSVFKMTDFESYRKQSKSWRSPRFYTHSGGYKMQLTVYAGGDGDGKGTFVSVSVRLVPGRNDDNLVWPFRGEVKVEILNQLDDSNHHWGVIWFTKKERNSENKKVCKKLVKFIVCSPLLLGHNVVINCQYLKDNTLYFRLSVQVYDSNKPWLICTN